MSKYTEYVTRMRRIADIYCSAAVLHWDLEVNMPKGGAQFRSQQIATLAGLSHEMFISRETGDLLDRLLDDDTLTSDQHRNVELSMIDYKKEVKLTKEFVERMSQAKSAAFNKWLEAREVNDFAVFQPTLETLIDLTREEAEIRGYGAEPYDAMLDLYERGLRASFLDTLFTQVREALIPLLGELIERQKPVGDNFLGRHYPHEDQWDFGLDLLKEMGYDFNRGRQDLSPHPFTISFAPTDVRVTTRVNENDFRSMTWSCIHEGGHALYEQGLNPEQYGLPLGQAASLSIHESQSRLWENHVGRSRAFWQHWYPKLQMRFPGNLEDVTLDDFYAEVNRIGPNLIRTEADELHYHLHVMVRYELERQCVNGDIPVRDLRDLWIEEYKTYLGVDVPDDNQGILQDVHWAHGSFGYFPTYSVGSFYAAQFFATAEREIDGLQSRIAKGDYSALLLWLRENIHVKGRSLDADDLCKEVTGEILDVKHFLRYAKDKYQSIHTKQSV